MELEVIAGTYEELVVGYKLVKEEEDYSWKPSFTNHSHCGSIRSIAVSDKFLATGSTDETIKLFNVERRVEVGSLVQQEGTITSLCFHENSHLFSSCEDGTICIWKTGNWRCLGTLYGHKAGIVSFSIHPSGKLGLSISKDKTLRTWNLITGEVAFVIRLKAVADIVKWSPDGNLFAVVINNRVDVYTVEKAGIIHSIEFGKLIHSVAFLTKDVIVIGGEGENIEIHGACRKALLGSFKAHAIRTKVISVVLHPEKPDKLWLVTSSSDGSIKLWDMHLKKLDEAPTVLAEMKTGCRITCHVVCSSSVETPDEGQPVEIKQEVELLDETQVKSVVDALPVEIKKEGEELDEVEGQRTPLKLKRKQKSNIKSAKLKKSIK